MIKPSVISAAERNLGSLSQSNIFPVTSEYFNHGLTTSQLLVPSFPELHTKDFQRCFSQPEIKEEKPSLSNAECFFQVNSCNMQLSKRDWEIAISQLLCS